MAVRDALPSLEQGRRRSMSGQTAVRREVPHRSDSRSGLRNEATPRPWRPRPVRRRKYPGVNQTLALAAVNASSNATTIRGGGGEVRVDVADAPEACEMACRQVRRRPIVRPVGHWNEVVEPGIVRDVEQHLFERSEGSVGRVVARPQPQVELVDQHSDEDSMGGGYPRLRLQDNQTHQSGGISHGRVTVGGAPV